MVDTSILVDHLRLGGNKSVYVRLLHKVEPVISFVSVAELYSGKSSWQPEHRPKIDELISGVEVKLASVARSISAGKIRAEFGLDIPDAFIAALSLELDVPLMTLNAKDFTKVFGIKFYKP